MRRALIVAMALIGAGSTALAADSNTLTVQANVVGTCKFVSGTSTLDFGNLDPSVNLPASASATTQFWCTKGVATDAIAPGNGLSYDGSKRNMKNGAEVIPYDLALSADGNPNAGPSSPRVLTINGTIAYADFKDKSAGAYSDTVTLTITP